MITLFNIGFTQKTAEEFFEKLRVNKIECLIDIRLNPNGQLSRFAFAYKFRNYSNKFERKKVICYVMESF